MCSCIQDSRPLHHTQSWYLADPHRECVHFKQDRCTSLFVHKPWIFQGEPTQPLVARFHQVILPSSVSGGCGTSSPFWRRLWQTVMPSDLITQHVAFLLVSILNTFFLSMSLHCLTWSLHKEPLWRMHRVPSGPRFPMYLARCTANNVICNVLTFCTDLSSIWDSDGFWN